MANSSPLRSYKSLCPGCGAGVEFLSAQSTHTICSFCQSTVARQGDVLSRVGKMAEVFEDFSPLQLMASGKYEGETFTVIGRLQYAYPEGVWSEWVCLLDGGPIAYLSEDNGSFVWSAPLSTNPAVLEASQYILGQSYPLINQSFTVSSTQKVSLKTAQGELGVLPPLNTEFDMIEMRSTDQTVISIDYSSTLLGKAANVSLGKAVELANLALTGLKENASQESKSRQFECPNCGSSIKPLFDDSKTITCSQCKSLIDLSSGIGAELKAATQENPVNPTIALGTVGKLDNIDWQIVGFQHRMGTDAQEPDESFGWSEYLLYNQLKGFSFLVESTEGWSWVKPLTGAPKSIKNGAAVEYLGKTYTLIETYNAKTYYVLGEFYWRVELNQNTKITDYSSGPSLIYREQNTDEIVWSQGQKLLPAIVSKAFNFDASKGLSEVGGSSNSKLRKQIILWSIIIILIIIVVKCSDDCNPKIENCTNRTYGTGGSYGGYNSGGSHK
jgi:hypothetical protein